MESYSQSKEPRIKQRSYKYLLLCLFLSLGISCTVLRNISFQSDQDTSESGPLTYLITRCCLAIALIFAEIWVWYVIRKRDIFHRNQQIFWPLRCLHCAEAIGILPQLKPTRNENNIHHGALFRSKSLDHVDQVSCGSSNVSLSRWTPDRQPNISKEVHNLTYGKPHRSLLNTFYIFATIGLIDIPLQLVAYMICLGTTERIPITHIEAVMQMLIDVILITLIFFAIIFFKNFYDASFVDDKKFVFPFAVTIALCMWLAADREFYPLGEIMNPKYDRKEYPCSPPGQFGKFINHDDRILTPLYAETAIICAGIVWHMWSSIFPRSCLKASVPTTQCQSLGPRYIKPFWRKSLSNIFGRRRLNFLSITSSREETINLLPKYRERQCRESPVVIGCILVIGIAYFSLCLVLEYSSLGLPYKYHTITVTYLKWFLQIVFYLPLFALYHYCIDLTGSFTSFRQRNTVSPASSFIGAHDLILFISCIGIFTLNIFRFVSAGGILLQTPRPPEDITLACFAGVFAIFKSYITWVMTSFLVVVQRQEIHDTKEAQWTLICLIYMGILNAIQWVIESMETHTWVELSTFYGPTQGKVIGSLLQPLLSLYGIHSAMIAYDSFKKIRKDF